MPEYAEKEGDRFAGRLRSLREKAALTQEELAERAGLTPRAISALERGARTHPYPHTVRALADALQVSEAERSALIASVPRRRTAEPPPDPPPVTNPADRARGRLALVVPPTQLYGRERDVAEVSRLVRSGDARLITLTGPGGVGKTRLAAAVCDELGADYPDGIVTIALSALADANEVMPSIVRALDTVAGDKADPVEVAATQLQGLRLLLVLDNFEHLLSAAVDVGRLVSACPTVTVLVTSRSLLRVRGEREYPVAPLTLPSPDVTSIEALAGSASGAFVLHRAHQVAPPLTMTSDDIQALGQICHRLAGLPLAIELATAHLRLLTPRDLLGRLEGLLTSTVRDLPERQRTMRATLDWSYQLLSPAQQTLFRMLSVFRGGATLAAVEEVAGVIELDDVLELVEELVEQSLIVVRPGGDLGRRYDMLEPVAQYARSLLVGDEAARVTRAHAQLFVELAERAATGYECAEQVLWLHRVQFEEANILVAIDRTLDGGDGETAGRIIWAMWLYWWLRSQPAVGLRRALQCLTLELSPAVLARVHLAAATMSYAAGDLKSSADHWDQAFRLGTRQSDHQVACAGRAGAGLVALGAGDLNRAEAYFRDALDLGQQAGDLGVWLRSLIHVWLGTILLLQSDITNATAEIDHGLRLARRRGDRLSTYIGLFNLSQAAISLGDNTLARGYLDEGISLSEQTQDLANLAYFLDALAVVESAENEPHRVAVLLGAAQALRDTAGALVYGYYLPDESLRTRAKEHAQSALGATAFEEALAAGRALELADSVKFALRRSP